MRIKGSLYWLIARLLLFSPFASRAAPDPLSEWQSSNVSDFNTQINAAAFGNGTFFATEWGWRYSPFGRLLTSTNGLSWQTVPLAGYARGIVFVDGTFIAVGAKTNNTALIMTSNDGANWVDVPGPTNIVLNGVCSGGGQYVAWGQQGLSFSNVGTAVTLVSSNTLDWLVYTNRQPYEQPYFDNMAFGDGTFAGTTGPLGEGLYFLVYTSTNGFNWTQRTGLIGFPGSGIAFGNHTFVANRVYSTNGVDFYPAGSSTYGITTVTFGNGTFLAAGWDLTCATSTDGFNWTAHGAPWGFNEGSYGAASAYGNSRFIVSDCDYAAIYCSGDVSIPSLSGHRAPPGFAFSLNGEINRPYHIQISDDLHNWSELMTVTNPLPITDYIDPTPISSINRYYRAFLQR